MARVRKIPLSPPKNRKNYFLVDACFLANKYIPHGNITNPDEKASIKTCKDWWKIITKQLKEDRARVYVPDICIAETYKVLAKKYYEDKIFSYAAHYKSARDRLSSDIRMSAKELGAQKRRVLFHDVPTTRDTIIAVDRFFELFFKKKKSVSIPDLMLVTSAKYLLDFYDLPKKQLHMITLDKALYFGIKEITELPNAYDPTEPADALNRIFE